MASTPPHPRAALPLRAERAGWLIAAIAIAGAVLATRTQAISPLAWLGVAAGAIALALRGHRHALILGTVSLLVTLGVEIVSAGPLRGAAFALASAVFVAGQSRGDLKLVQSLRIGAIAALATLGVAAMMLLGRERVPDAALVAAAAMFAIALAWPGVPAGSRARAAAFIAACAGIGAMATGAWAFGPTTVRMLGLGGVPIAGTAALAFLLAGVGGIAVLGQRVREGRLLLAATATLALLSLAMRPPGEPWAPDGVTPPLWMSPSTALALLAASLGLAVSPRRSSDPRWSAFSWGCGLTVAAIATLAFIAANTNLAPLEAWVSRRPMAPLATAGLALLAAGLLTLGLSERRDERVAAVWLPTVAAALGMLVTMAIFLMLVGERVQERRARSESAARELAYAIENYLLVRLSGIDRLAGRLGVVPPEVVPRLFAADAASLRSDVPGLYALGRHDEATVLLQIESEESLRYLEGSAYASDPLRSAAIAAARESDALRLSAPLSLRAGGTGFAAVRRVRGERGPEGYLIGALRYQPLLDAMLATTAPELALRVEDAGTVIWSRGAITPNTEPARASAQIFGRRWALEVHAPPPAGVAGWLPEALLMLGLVASALLAGMLRVAATAQSRSAALEAAADALRRSRALLDRSQQVAAIGSWSQHIGASGPDESLVWSDQTFRIFGYEPGEVPATLSLFVSHVHPEDRPQVRAAFDAALAARETYRIDHRIVRRDGSVRHVHEEAVFEAQGDDVLAVGTVQDITERKLAEITLDRNARATRAAHARLRLLIDATDDLVVVTDAKGRYLEVSRAVQGVLGYRPEEMIGRSFAEFLHPDDRVRSIQRAREIVAGESRGTDYRDRYRHRDGHYVPLVWSVAWSEAEQAAIGIARDASAQQQREDAAAAQAQVLAAIARGAPLRGVLEQLVSLAEREVAGARAAVVQRREDGDRLCVAAGGLHADSFQNAEVRVSGAGQGSAAASVRERRTVVCTDVEHDPIWADRRDFARAHRIRASWAQPILTPGGEALGALTLYFTEPREPRDGEIGALEVLSGTAAVAFERERAVAALEAGEQRFRSIFDHHPDAVFELDREGRYTAGNPMLARITGHPLSSLIGHTFRRIVPEGERERRDRLFARALAGESLSYDATIVRADGSPAYIYATLIPLRVRGIIEGVFGVTRDVTHLRRTELQLVAALERSERQARQLRGLARAAIEVGQRLLDAGLDDWLVETARNALGANLSALKRRGASGGAFAVSLAEPYAPWRGFAELPDGSGIYAQVLEQGRPLRLGEADLAAAPGYRGFSGRADQHVPLRGLLAVPMLGGEGSVHGVLMFSDKHGGGDFDEVDEAVAMQFAHLAGVVIERARLLAEREQAQARLLASEQRYRVMFEAIEDPLFVLGPDADGALRFERLNPAVGKVFGIDPASLLGRTPADISPPEQPGMGPTQAAVERLAAAALRGETQRFEWRFRRRDGSEFDAELTLWSLELDGRTLLQALARDITDRKRAEQLLLERDRFFQMSQELFCIASEERFLQINSAFERLLGHPAHVLLSRPYAEFLHPDDAAHAGQAARTLRETGKLEGFTSRFRHADGHYVWLEWTSTRAPEGAIYAVARDITERRLAQAELARAMEDLELRNRELQDFAFVASHDLQEPLRKILAFGDRLAESTPLEGVAADHLARMRNAAQRMQTLIDDLLAYSRVTTRGQAFVAVDLGQVLAEVVGDLETAIEDAGACVDQGALPIVHADPLQMRQLLQNLLSNALKFRDAGRPCRVRVHGEPFRRDGEPWVALRVEDNGIGFDNRYRDKIFAPFHRLHGRSQYPGTGIGLAIVRRIVERHGGAIVAEGVPGAGATFTIELPTQARGAAAGTAGVIVAGGA